MKSEKSSASRKQLRMFSDADITAEARTLVRRAAEPVVPGERTGGQLWRAAQRLGISYSKTKAFWYGERRRIAASELRNLQARYDALAERAEYRKAVLDDMDKALLRARAIVGDDGEEVGSLLGLASGALAKSV